MESVFVEKKRTPFLALPFCFETYYINEEKITIKSGFVNTVEDDAYMYKVQDVKLTRSLLERIFGLGSIICYTGDTTHPELEFLHIKHASQIKEYLITASEEARRKRRTLHALDIDAEDNDADNEEAM